MTAISWRWVIRLTQRGKDSTEFVSAIATFATKAVRSGRRLCRMAGRAARLCEDQQHFAPGKVVQRDFLAIGTRQREVRRVLAPLEAVAPHAPGRGRFELLQPPAEKPQATQCSQQQKTKKQDEGPQGYERHQHKCFQR
jgi:hypothetical protein